MGGTALSGEEPVGWLGVLQQLGQLPEVQSHAAGLPAELTATCAWWCAVAATGLPCDAIAHPFGGADDCFEKGEPDWDPYWTYLDTYRGLLDPIPAPRPTAPGPCSLPCWIISSILCCSAIILLCSCRSLGRKSSSPGGRLLAHGRGCLRCFTFLSSAMTFSKLSLAVGLCFRAISGWTLSISFLASRAPRAPHGRGWSYCQTRVGTCLSNVPCPGLWSGHNCRHASSICSTSGLCSCCMWFCYTHPVWCKASCTCNRSWS